MNTGMKDIVHKFLRKEKPEVPPDMRRVVEGVDREIALSYKFCSGNLKGLILARGIIRKEMGI